MAHFVGAMFFLIIGMVQVGWAYLNCSEMRWDGGTIAENALKFVRGGFCLVFAFVLFFHFI
jgi:hypothetical protein